MGAPNTLTPEISRKATRKLEKKKKKQKSQMANLKKGHIDKVGPSFSKKNDGTNETKPGFIKQMGNNPIKKQEKSHKKLQANGPIFGHNLDARMAALQQFIDNEIQSSSVNSDRSPAKSNKQKDSLVSSGKKSGKKNGKGIKDTKRLEELNAGIENDDKEIKYLQRQLQFNSRQKESNNMFRNLFGADIGDLFDTLESEPSEADMLSEKPLLPPQLHCKAKNKPKLELPKNTIFVETSKVACEHASSLATTAQPDIVKSKKWKRQPDIEEAHELEPEAKIGKYCEHDRQKITKKNISLCSENKSNLGKSALNLSNGSTYLIATSSPSSLKPIINTKAKKFKKNGRLSVSFDLGKNAVRFIPPIIKEAGFTVLDNNAPLFCDTVNEVSLAKGEKTLKKCKKPKYSDTEEDIQMRASFCYAGKKKSCKNFHNETLNVDALDFNNSDVSNFGTGSIERDSSDGELNSEESQYSGNDVRSDYSDSDEDTGSEIINCDFSDMLEGFEDGVGGSSDDDVHMEAEFTDSDDSGDDEDFVEESNLETDDNCQVVKPKVCEAEDIYGRLRDSEGNVIEENTGTKVSSYLTPEQRKHDETLQEQLRDDAIKRVRTQLRGRLNRLAEVNLAGTVTMVCSLYGNHPRHLLNVVFSELLLAELASEMLTLDRHCQECAVLLAAVASNVAEEIGAHILTDFVVSWHEEMQKGAEANSARLRNYVMFVCHLFSFGLLHSALIYDILKKLTSQLTAHSVDQMILVMNSVGFLLRKEDPLSLKDFIVAVQREGSSSNIPQLQLLNTMLRAIKNNNESKMPDYDPTYTEHLRKLLKSYVGGDLKVTALRVTLDDLLHSETRGRWWIVGSAWTGGSLMQAYKPSDHANAAKSLSTETKFSAEFMKMAESMRITRPPKINILFALTVGSDSVEEAIIKLKELSLAPSQEKLIFDVMLYCVQKMRVYKSFYAILSSRMCDNEHKYKRLLQHALWDKLSDIDAIKSKELKNMAKFILQIVKEDALNLSVLKTLPFAETNQKIVGFLEDVFCQLFKHEEGDHVSYDAFKKLFLSKKLQPLRLQFKLFIQVFIMPKCESGELDTRCRQRVERVIDLLSSDMGALL